MHGYTKVSSKHYNLLRNKLLAAKEYKKECADRIKEGRYNRPVEIKRFFGLFKKEVQVFNEEAFKEDYPELYSGGLVLYSLYQDKYYDLQTACFTDAYMQLAMIENLMSHETDVYLDDELSRAYIEFKLAMKLPLKD